MGRRDESVLKKCSVLLLVACMHGLGVSNQAVLLHASPGPET